jgi:hypothetical protein
MKFARYVFLIAGIYGLFVTFPLYFMEAKLSADYPPPMNHLENYYSFIGVTVVWQILFLFIARDPLRFRPVMVFCSLEKLSLVPTFLVLFPRGLYPQAWIPLLVIDLALGVLFVISHFKTKELLPVSNAATS